MARTMGAGPAADRSSAAPRLDPLDAPQRSRSGAVVSDSNEQRRAAESDAQRAFGRSESTLRRLGALGEIAVGLDPSKPEPTRWWARCVVGPLTRPTELLVEGFGSGLDALGALCELAGRPRQQ